jgi:hypothetical protein
MSSSGTMQTPSSPHEPHPSLAAYALGVLDPEERDELEVHLEACALCRAELDRYETVTGGLGMVVAPAPPRPELRARLLGEIRAEERRANLPSPLPFRRHVPVAWLAVAAAIAVLSVIAAGVMFQQVREVRDERDSAMYAQEAVADYLKDGGTLSALIPAPDSPDDAAEGHGSLIVAPDQNGAMLVVYDLRPTEDGRIYQAWAEKNGERVDLGELHVNHDGVGWLYLYGPEPMRTYETVGLTLVTPERPEGETFLVATVQ